MITILSPAKTLDFDTPSIIEKKSSPIFMKESNELIKILKNLSIPEIEDLMSVNHDIASLNHYRFQNWQEKASPENGKQNILAFSGEVYRGLDANSLSEEDLLFAQDNLVVLSGLYGILRPLDIIQPYRLEMGTKLKNKSGSNLYNFWKEKLNKKMNELIDNSGTQTLINLASNEYFKALNPKNIEHEIITPVFKELKGNNYKVVTVYAKKARGLMARFIVKQRIRKPEDIKGFDLEGYHFNHDLSTEKEWLFTR